MKKLIASLFALSAISAFADGTSTPSTGLDSARINVEIKAKIKSQTQLIISDAPESGTSRDIIIIHHGGKDGIDKANIDAKGVLSTGATAYLRRTGEDTILFHNRETKNPITISLQDTATLSSTSTGGTIKTTLGTKLGSMSTDGKSIPFSITSTLDKGQVLAAKAANDYTTGNITLTVTIDN